MKTPPPSFVLLPGMALALAVSIRLLSLPLVRDFRHILPEPAALALRQGLFAAFAVVLAWGLGRFRLHRPLLRHWILFPGLLLLVMLAAPVTAGMGSGRWVNGYGWWTRSTGHSLYMLALVFTSCSLLPRFANREKGAARSLALLIALSAAIPLLFLRSFDAFFLGFGVLALLSLASLGGRRLALACTGLVLCFMATLAGFLAVHPNSFRRLFNLCDDTPANFQLRQALLSIHSGGWMGSTSHPTWIPEWHNDFIFARLCAAGGLLGALAVFLGIGLFFTWAWRIAAKQNEAPARALAAGCAAALVLPALLHVAINIGLFPTGGVVLPFLSYGPRFLLFHALLAGLLLSLRNSDGPALPLPWPMKAVPPGICLLLTLFALRLFVLVFASPQLGDHFKEEQERIARRLSKRRPPERGRIVDTAGRVLAQSRRMFIACADPHLYSTLDDPRLLPEIARLLDMDETPLRQRFANSKQRYVRLKMDVPDTTAAAIRNLGTQAFFIDTVPVRDYPFETPLVHLLGCCGLAEEHHGLSGVELTHNTLLRGGGDLKLTLDIHLQNAVQTLVESLVAETQSRQAQAVVLDARSGAIRAAAQVPALHGMARRDGDLASMRWLAIGSVFEPGGLLKPLVLASAVDRGLVHPESLIDCEQGLWMFDGFPLRDPDPHGNLPPSAILRNNSNIGMAKIGLMFGKEDLHATLLRWGLDAPVTTGVGASESGILHPAARWTDLDVTRISIGHGCAVSLLQLLRAYTAFFNDGNMIEPRLIESTRGAPNLPWQTTAGQSPQAVIRPETAAFMQIAMARSGNETPPAMGQSAFAHKPFADRSGYDPGRVMLAHIGSHTHEGTPYLIAVWIDEPAPGQGPRSAVQSFQKIIQLLPADLSGPPPLPRHDFLTPAATE